jgi:hypothetical protein
VADAHDPEAARVASRELAASYGLEILETLPLIDAEELDQLRSAIEVFERCLALDAVLEIVHGGEQDEILADLKKGDLMKHLSERERAYVERRAAGDDDEHERIQITWRVEGLYAMAWALGGVDDLPVTGIVQEGGDLAEKLSDSPELRSPRELGAKLDAFYCLHWAVVERDVSGEPADWPEELDPGAIMERRWGLEWIAQSDVDDWEDVALDT